MSCSFASKCSGGADTKTPRECGVPTLNVHPHVMPGAVHPRLCCRNGNAQLLSRFTSGAAPQIAQQHYAPELRLQTRDRSMNCDLNFLALIAFFGRGS